MVLIFRRRYRPPPPLPPPTNLRVSSVSPQHQGVAAYPTPSVAYPGRAPLMLQLSSHRVAPIAHRRPRSLGSGGRGAPQQQRPQASSDIGGSGGVPRRATAWETEARSVPAFLARIVNTEGPGP